MASPVEESMCNFNITRDKALKVEQIEMGKKKRAV